MHKDKRELAETLHSIGVLTRKRKNLEAAREPLLDALEIRRNLTNGRETGQTLLEIGNIFRLQSDFESAVSLYDKSLEVLDEKDDIRGSVHLALGHAMLSSNRDRDAIRNYDRALQIRVAAYGKDNLKTGNVSRSLGLAKYLLNQTSASLLHLNEFMRVIELNDEEDNEEEGEDVDYVLTIILMFDIYRASNNSDRAKSLIQIAKEVCDESEELREELPALVEMTERRFKLSQETTRSSGLLSRLNLSEEAEANVEIDPKEAEILRQIAFIDD
jgi:tetratricopeptide (TPR) repeat protein